MKPLGIYAFTVVKSILLLLLLKKCSCTLNEGEEGKKIQTKRNFWTPDDLLHPKLPHLHHKLVVELCKSMKKIQNPEGYQYLWAKIDSVPEPSDHAINRQGGNKTADVKNQGHLPTTPGCHVYIWKNCVGKPRFPLPATCGFFDIVHLPVSQCQKEGTKSENVQSSILIDHVRALELCMTAKGVDKMSSKAVKTSTVKYVPVRVDVNSNRMQDVSLYCLGWRYQPEGSVWHKEFQSENKKCLPFTSTWDHNSTANGRSTSNSDVKNQVQEVSSPALDLTRHTNIKDLNEDGQNLHIFRDLIYCSRTKDGDGTICKVLPKTKSMSARRLKRGASTSSTGNARNRTGSEPNSPKTKRQVCCNPHECYPCNEEPVYDDESHDFVQGYDEDQAYGTELEIYEDPPTRKGKFSCNAECGININTAAAGVKDTTTGFLDSDLYNIAIGLTTIGSVFFPPLAAVAIGLGVFKAIFGAKPEDPMIQVTAKLNEIVNKLQEIETKIEALKDFIVEQAAKNDFAKISTKLLSVRDRFIQYNRKLTPQLEEDLIAACQLSNIDFYFFARILEGQVATHIPAKYQDEDLPYGPYQSLPGDLSLLRVMAKSCSADLKLNWVKTITTTFMELSLLEASCQAVKFKGDEPAALNASVETVTEFRERMLTNMAMSMKEGVIDLIPTKEHQKPCARMWAEEFGTMNRDLTHREFVVKLDDLLNRFKSPLRKWIIVSFQFEVNDKASDSQFQLSDPDKQSFFWIFRKQFNRNMIVISPWRELEWKSYSEAEKVEDCFRRRMFDLKCSSSKYGCTCNDFVPEFKICRDASTLKFDGFIGCWGYFPALGGTNYFVKLPAWAVNTKAFPVYSDNWGMKPPCNNVQRPSCPIIPDYKGNIWTILMA